MNELTIARINNVDIVSTVNDGETLVPIKPICTAIGIDSKSQRNKIERHPILSSVGVIMTSTGSDGKHYEMMCLPVEHIFGWLFTIGSNSVSEEARPNVLRYQKECYHTLYAHFAGTSKRESEQNQIEIRLLEEINDLTEDMQRTKKRTSTEERKPGKTPNRPSKPTTKTFLMKNNS